MYPRLLEIRPLYVYSYGVILDAAYLDGLKLATIRARSRGLNTARVLDLEVALVVQLADVPGGVVAVGGERLLGRRLVLPVPGEDRLAGDQDLPVVGDPHGHAGQRLAHGADLLPLRPVDRHPRAGLGQPVPLEDGYPGAAEEVPQPGREGRAAGDRPLGLAAQRGPQ